MAMTLYRESTRHRNRGLLLPWCLLIDVIMSSHGSVPKTSSRPSPIGKIHSMRHTPCEVSCPCFTRQGGRQTAEHQTYTDCSMIIMSQSSYSTVHSTECTVSIRSPAPS
ncbi:hypothetical protein P152DRAFT_188766 [Eremomyces bilateralis CBS 781.70]|uniref:Secreted protein n=1 Tax=Eremomyces bilateralis CBS 781.70 TaxID=1392243 RepID=A0A6G1GBW7_9PEZI|nr:uncharacterized protein P152DRAFT_188766 [Eremomyces bilateralis CBS 781.70]KAF1815543.1 hypothetical protein P152DRAFT_188766 [Eremomyces bilateralis CBS 781.70]